MEIEPARRLASINARELAEFRQNRLQIPKLGGPHAGEQQLDSNGTNTFANKPNLVMVSHILRKHLREFGSTKGGL